MAVNAGPLPTPPNPMGLTRSKRLFKAFKMIGLIGLAVYFLWYVVHLPESNCTTKSVAALWAPDRAYKATLLEKKCNLSESLFYSVRVDAYSPPLKTGWFVPGFELENDQYPTGHPQLRWATPRRLEISVATRTMTGSLVENAGDDLTVVRTYTAHDPGAFPNYN